MARDDGGTAGTIVVTFVLGALTGAAVALLMAPATGDEIRRKVVQKAKEGRETFSSAVERGREAYNQARRSEMPPPATPGESL